jgi:signal transduction histidine kinase
MVKAAGLAKRFTSFLFRWASSPSAASPNFLPPCLFYALPRHMPLLSDSDPLLQVPMPLWLVDPHSFQILDANPAAVSAYGYSREQFRDLTLSSLAAEGGEAGFPATGPLRARHRTRLGPVLHVLLHQRPAEVSGRPVLIVTAADITALIGERDGHAHDAERARADIEQLAHAAAHDLKEPLRGIILNASFLEEDYKDALPPEAHRLLKTISRMATRTSALVDAMVSWCHVARAPLNIERCDLAQVVAEVVERLHLTDAEVQVGPLPTVQCDCVNAARIFSSLLSNAAKFTTASPKRIAVGSAPPRTAGGPPVMFVRDNGIGLPADYQRIFKVFKRLHRPEEFGGGAGIGLALVQKMVQRHGGEVWAESRPQEGTTFYFTLAPEPGL